MARLRECLGLFRVSKVVAEFGLTISGHLLGIYHLQLRSGVFHLMVTFARHRWNEALVE